MLVREIEVILFCIMFLAPQNQDQKKINMGVALNDVKMDILEIFKENVNQKTNVLFFEWLKSF